MGSSGGTYFSGGEERNTFLDFVDVVESTFTHRRSLAGLKTKNSRSSVQPGAQTAVKRSPERLRATSVFNVREEPLLQHKVRSASVTHDQDMNFTREEIDGSS